MKLYIQLFLVAALGYGGVAGLILNNPLIGVLFGVGMGVVLAAIFGTLQHQAFQGKKQGAEHNVHQIRELELDMPYADAYGLCIEAIATLGGISIKQSSRLEGVIEARTHLNWQTYGERISVQLVRVDDDTTQVRVESRPRIKAALTDFGRNLHNINRLTVFLRKHSSSDALNPRLETLDEAPLTDDDYPFIEALLPAKR